MKSERTTSNRPTDEPRANRRVRIFRTTVKLGVAVWFFSTAFGLVGNGFSDADGFNANGSDARAAEQRKADDASGGGVLFVPTRDLAEPTVFSAVDAARRNRPPQPTKIREDLFYPDGFLEPSTPTPEPVDETADKTPTAAPIPRGLNPAAETTPLSPPGAPESLEDGPKRGSGDKLFFFATSIALAALGLFLYFDYRYRDRLKADLARNARLRDPSAVGADFDDVLARAEAEGELCDSYFDPTLDVPDFSGRSANPALNGANDSTDSAASLGSTDVAEPSTPESFAATCALALDLTEENFDFKPSERKPRIEEPQEDFVVGANVGR